MWLRSIRRRQPPKSRRQAAVVAGAVAVDVVAAAAALVVEAVSAAALRRPPSGRAWWCSSGRTPTTCCFPAPLPAARHLTGRAAAVDVNLGKGHIVMFALRPFWRWQTQGTYFLAFNAILNWDHLDAGKAAPAAGRGTAPAQ